MTTQNTPNSSEQYETSKLGIDAHAKWYYVSRQVDGLEFAFAPAAPETVRMRAGGRE